MSDRIEQRSRLRSERLLDAARVLRGGPDTIDKLRRHAARTARAWSLDGVPLLGVSVFVALDDAGGASLPALFEQMRWYRLVHVREVGDVAAAGFTLLPTGARPHFTVRLERA
jgi:hypothetical protein